MEVLQTSVERSSVTVDHCSSIWPPLSHTGWEGTGFENSSCPCSKHDYCSCWRKLVVNKRSVFWWCFFISRHANKIHPWKCFKSMFYNLCLMQWLVDIELVEWIRFLPHFRKPPSNLLLACLRSMQIQLYARHLVLWFFFLKLRVSNTCVRGLVLVISVFPSFCHTMIKYK